MQEMPASDTTPPASATGPNIVGSHESTGMARVWRGLRWSLASLAVAGALIAAGTLGLVDTSSSVHAQSQGGAVVRGGLPPSFADVVEQVSGAVVSIHVTNGGRRLTGRKRGQRNMMPPIPEDSPFFDFFKRFGQGPRGLPIPQVPTRAEGSGFIISPDGYVVTNNHVIDEATEITVSIDENEKYKAELVGADPRTDLALLKIKSDKTFNYVEFTDRPVRVGDWVIAVGNPFGLGGTVTAGIVSARGRAIGSGPYDYIQIDAAVNKGNSGGPTFNLAGEVVGVNTAIFSPSGGNVGIAFAVPAELAKRVVRQLREKGSVSRGWLGVHIQSINEELAEGLGLEEPAGALVTRITKNGPASRSDLQVGDAIVKVNGEKVADSRDLARKIAALEPKSIARITIVRDGRERDIEVTLGRFPSKQKLARLEQGAPLEEEELDEFGLSLAPASSRGKADARGVVITGVAPGSEARKEGLREGDIILKVGSTSVDEPNDVTESIRAARERGLKRVLLLVKSGDQTRFVTLPLKKKES